MMHALMGGGSSPEGGGSTHMRNQPDDDVHSIATSMASRDNLGEIEALLEAVLKPYGEEQSL